MIFIFHVILQDHVIRALYDFMVSSPSSKVTIVPSFVEINGFSLWRSFNFSQDHVIKISRDFMGGTP